jgi:nitric oxide reductase NorE protein
MGMELKAKTIPVAVDYKDIASPPGGVLIWIVIFLEVITFGLGLMGLAYYGRLEPSLFHESRLQLNITLGSVNTVILLTSGYFMARAVQSFKMGNLARTNLFFRLTLLGGLLFTLIKAFEYYAKIEAGLGMDANMFFTSYWLLTGFHLVHVLVGMVILGWIQFKMNRPASDINADDVEAGAAFWHMCDLIWLLLFPALYLIF